MTDRGYGVPPATAADHETSRDARERAVRSFLWGLLVDVGTGVVLVLMTAFTSIEWTGTYWQALGLLLAKSVLQAVVAFFGRKLLPPVSADHR